MTGFIEGGTAAAMVWVIAAAAIAGVLFRPKQWPEAIWACVGAVLLVLFRLLPADRAAAAVGRGTDVYLFLTGMMLLSELARREGVFDWLATLAVRSCKQSKSRLFLLIYGVGTVVTVFLSNDATAVVLTPAVYAAVKKAKTEALPYLFICAFIANAASFVLPISNPANLVVYGKSLPPLGAWLAVFFAPSVLSIGATYAGLRWLLRRDVQGKIEEEPEPAQISGSGKRALGGIVFTGGVLMVASALGADLGLPTCAAAVVSVIAAVGLNCGVVGAVVKGVSWSVLPLVGGLFVIVEALNSVGAGKEIGRLLNACAGLSTVAGGLTASFGVAALSNLMNNLPSGLLAGGAARATHVAAAIRDSVLIGIDLGPNLSVTGSLATILWLIALRREGEHVSGVEFLKVGMIVMPPALLLATLAAVLLAR